MSRKNVDVNVSKEVYESIYRAIEIIYNSTGRRPKYSEIQGIHRTSNSYIQRVLVDWLDDNENELNSAIEDDIPSVIGVDRQSVQLISDILTLENRKVQNYANAKFDKERRVLEKELRENNQKILDLEKNVFELKAKIYDAKNTINLLNKEIGHIKKSTK